MSSIGIPEIVLVLIVALVVLGPEKLPGAARQAGRFVSDLRGQASDLRRQFDDAVQQGQPREQEGSEEPERGPHPGTDGFELIDRHTSKKPGPEVDGGTGQPGKAERYPRAEHDGREA